MQLKIEEAVSIDMDETDKDGVYRFSIPDSTMTFCIWKDAHDRPNWSVFDSVDDFGDSGVCKSGVEAYETAVSISMKIIAGHIYNKYIERLGKR